MPVEAWRHLAVIVGVVSTVGIVVFLKTWPVFNTAAALGMNSVPFLLALLWHN